MSGVNLFFLGIIGEYVGRIYEEAKARPHYVVRKIVGQRNSGSREIPAAWGPRVSSVGTD